MLFRVMANYTNSITLDSFQLIWADRTSESGKRKGGGLVVFVNYRWWNSGHMWSKSLMYRHFQLYFTQDVFMLRSPEDQEKQLATQLSSM